MRWHDGPLTEAARWGARKAVLEARGSEHRQRRLAARKAAAKSSREAAARGKAGTTTIARRRA